MKNSLKRVFIKILSLLMIVCAMGLFGCECSSNKDDVKGEVGLTYTETKICYVGETFDPSITPNERTQVVEVVILDENSNEMTIGENYSFVPTAVGQYKYVIKASADKVEKVFEFSLIAIDKNGPLVPTEKFVKNAEIGIYTNFAQDIKSFKINELPQENAEHFVSKVIKVALGETVYTDMDGIEKFFFGEKGEYIVTVQVTNLAGISSQFTYTINVADSSAPQVKKFSVFYGWENDGKVKLPSLLINENSAYNVTVKAFDGVTELAVENGMVNATVGDQITLKVAVTDSNENKTEFDSTLKVLQAGVVLDGAEQGFKEYLVAKTGIVFYDAVNGGVSVVNDLATDGIEWVDGGYNYDFEQYKDYQTVAVKVKSFNQNASELIVLAKTVKGKIAVGKMTFGSVGNNAFVEKTGEFDITAVKGEKILGWCFDYSSDKTQTNFVIKEIKYLNTTVSFANTNGITNVDIETAHKGIDFESQDSFTFDSVNNGGFSENTDNAYVTNNLKSAKAEVKAGLTVGALFKNRKDVDGNVNKVDFDLIAKTSGKVKVGFYLTNSANANLKNYLSQEINLNKGVNSVGFILTSGAESLTGVKVCGLTITNLEKFDNVIYIDNITFKNATALLDSEIFNELDANAFTAHRGESFTVPKVIKCNENSVKEVSATIKTDGSSIPVVMGAMMSASQTAELDASKNYTIEYKVKDVFDVYHTLNANLICKKQPLKSSLSLDKYNVGELHQFDCSTVESEIFTATQLENLVIEKYYKAKNGYGWLSANDGVTPNLTGMMSYKIVLRLPSENAVKVLSQNSYIHAKGVTFDFEQYGSYSHLGEGVQYSTKGQTPMIITDDWAHDGEYSMKIEASKNYDDCGGYLYGVRNDQNPADIFEDGFKDYYTNGKGEVIDIYRYFAEEKYDVNSKIDLGFEADAMVFWAYAGGDLGTVTISFDNYDWKYSMASFNPLKGEHKYILKFDKPVKTFKRFMIETKRAESFYMDSIAFVQLATVNFQDISEGQFVTTDDIKLTKPVLERYSDVAFTPEELESAKAYCEIKNGFKVTKVDLNKDTTVKLPVGEYEITYHYEVGVCEFVSNTMKFTVYPFAVKFVKPQVIYNVGVDYEIEMPQADESVQSKLFIRDRNQTEWTEITQVNDGKAILRFTSPSEYEIKFVSTRGADSQEKIYNALCRSDDLLADFELDEDGTHNGLGNYSGDRYFTNFKQGKVTDEWAYDGQYSFHVKATGYDFMAIYYFEGYGALWGGVKNLSKRYNAISMYINSDHPLKSVTLQVYARADKNNDGTKSWRNSQPIDVEIGVHKYTFVFEETFDAILGFGMTTHYNGQAYTVDEMYIDKLTLENIEYVFPTVTEVEDVSGKEIKSIKQNCTLNFEIPDYSETEQSVKVRYLGDNDYTTVTKADGKYTFKVVNSGTIEIVITYVKGETVLTGNYRFEVLKDNTPPPVNPDDPEQPITPPIDPDKPIVIEDHNDKASDDIVWEK